MRTELTSASAKCSRTEKLYRAVAAGCCAAAFFFTARPSAAMTLEGMPEWLSAHVARGLSAVWEEIPAGREDMRLETLSLVARRLFTGYDIAVSAQGEATSPHVVFKAQNPIRWRFVLNQPDLRAPVTSWFIEDTRGMAEEIEPLLDGLPMDALSWADSALRDRIREAVEGSLPGWDFSLLARMDARELQVSFHPRQPLVLAVTPSIFSSTLPVMFQTDLTAKLIPGLSPVIGLPVGWVALHRRDVELLAQELLEDRNAVSNTRSKVEVAFAPAQVSKVDASVNSERLVFQIWLAAYAGIRERYPEAGVLLGWNTRQFTGADLTLYSEAIVDTGEFGVSTRLGLRFPLLRQFYVGIEAEWPEQEIWYRAWWSPERVRRPYAWWRYSALGHNAAVGYRLNEYLSVEIHYDGRYDDKIGLRGILQL